MHKEKAKGQDKKGKRTNPNPQILQRLYKKNLTKESSNK